MTKNIFSHISHHKIADQAVMHIENLIVEGILRFGDRLPPERELAQQLNISRPVLRKAIQNLEDKALLTTRPGGGTYITDMTAQTFTEPITELIGRHSKATLDYLEYRRTIESITTKLAAQRATAADKDLLSNIAEAMMTAHELSQQEKEAALDIELHNTIGECAHNIIFLHSLRSCYRLLSDGVIFNRAMIYQIRGAHDELLKQHLSIINAIIANDDDTAQKAAEAHMDYVISSFHKAKRLNEREHISQLRLQQRK